MKRERRQKVVELQRGRKSSVAAKEMNSKRGYPRSTSIYSRGLSIWVLLLQEVATSNSTICAGREHGHSYFIARWLHRRYRHRCNPDTAMHHPLFRKTVSSSPHFFIISHRRLSLRVYSVTSARIRVHAPGYHSFLHKIGRPFPPFSSTKPTTIHNDPIDGFAEFLMRLDLPFLSDGFQWV